MGSLVVILIVVGIGLFFFIAAMPSGYEPPNNQPSNVELEKIMATDIGHYKVEAAIRQARRLGVGILIHEGKVYSIVNKDSPRQGTKEFKEAHKRALDEKLKKHS